MDREGEIWIEAEDGVSIGPYDSRIEAAIDLAHIERTNGDLVSHAFSS